jgi:hypothetical protein
MQPEHIRTADPAKRSIHEKIRSAKQDETNKSASFQSPAIRKNMKESRCADEDTEAYVEMQLEEARIKLRQALDREAAMTKEMQRRENAHEDQVAVLFRRLRAANTAGERDEVCAFCMCGSGYLLKVFCVCLMITHTSCLRIDPHFLPRMHADL